MRTVAFLAASVVVGTTLADGLANDVTLVQDAVTQQVTVSYALSADAVVTLDIETNGVKLARTALTGLLGDVNRRVAATTGSERRVIRWNPKACLGASVQTVSMKALVKVWPDASPPDYLMHDLRTMRSSYYETEAELPYGPVTNAFYKSYALVMRKIPAAATFLIDGL